MLNRIIKFSIENKLIIGICTLMLIIWGVYALTRLPVDAVPDITNNQVQVITHAPALATQEIEQFVTYPVEQSIANLPDVEEIRSISRFGLSVVTIVFDDNVDIYFARQLVLERLRAAEEQIPPGIGTPELAPVSTGLGEIYQYTIQPRPGSEGKYSATDLRTMQDWIVARQLYGTPGVAEVNSFGGMVKQYEVAVNPLRLKAMNVSIAELITALEQNNQNTGGAYIDRRPKAYFIRGVGLINNIEDIGNIVVKKTSSIPVFIKDVAEVRFGHAVRYGALTKDGKGEAVGGVVMMLKGSNSNTVTKDVKARLQQISQSLPSDIEIQPYLDRTELVGRAIGTVEHNLIAGALIVIFVLVLFLGNLRAGLIVASAIPLSMLFALGMMHVFGISANLMSLGAIDFGLVVDGAVIVVEATMHHLGLRAGSSKLSRKEMDQEVFLSASKIRTSAAFGEIIILIVYIPILTLTGIEGRMFRPMAQTVSFAIMGALILSLTYIPMMCALVLSRQIKSTRTLSDRLMDFFQRIYQPLLEAALRARRMVITIAVALLAVSLFIFSRMGGEFIPQLQEGDFAFHCILPQGASLAQSIETSLQAEQILMSFPEVKQVVGKTGTAEVPTDPMPPEATDLIIVLKNKSEWTTTDDYNTLAEMMMEKLSVIPGVFFEASQPIQMRFNELMTGVRQDVAVKIFGEHMDTMAALAPKIAAIISQTTGAGAPQTERTGGLPQINVVYDRARIAGYGLNIETVNQALSTAFAGHASGVVFENERRFDLVVRLDTAYRMSIDDVANLYIPVNENNQIPLSQIATITLQDGPAQISREDAKRRMVIGFNIHDRDVQSVVHDIRARIDKEIQLPTGYYITYGGSFENLEKATARLQMAVPLSLFLIFVLLYFTFGSAKQAVLIFTAIPMSAIGGIFALLIRGMPFSISAGVGFIALFGVAVLNGIVLISTFNQLKRDGLDDAIERVRKGTKTRLRPVLMTAMVASLGFLPMAISTGSGAEVQRPLATVVIGGLVTATLLTLVVLPLLYLWFEKKSTGKPKGINVITPLLFILSISIPGSLLAQDRTATRISYEDALVIASGQNLTLRGSTLSLQQKQALTGSAFSLPKTGLFVENEDLRPTDKVGILKIGVIQEVPWPGIYSARKEALRAEAAAAAHARNNISLELRRNLQTSYYTLWYHQSKMYLWQQLDSLYKTLASTAVLRVQQGESAGLDSISARAKSAEVHVQLNMIYSDIAAQQEALKVLMNTDSSYLPEARTMERIPKQDTSQLNGHPRLRLWDQYIAASEAEMKIARRSALPDFSGRFFSQRLYGLSNPFAGFSVSAGIPIGGIRHHRAVNRAAALERDYRQTMQASEQKNLEANARQANLKMQQEEEMLHYYETQGLSQADAILKAAQLSYQAGEISFAALSQFLTQAIDIQRNYLDVLHQYNQSVIAITYYYNYE